MARCGHRAIGAHGGAAGVVCLRTAGADMVAGVGAAARSARAKSSRHDLPHHAGSNCDPHRIHGRGICSVLHFGSSGVPRSTPPSVDPMVRLFGRGLHRGSCCGLAGPSLDHVPRSVLADGGGAPYHTFDIHLCVCLRDRSCHRRADGIDGPALLADRETRWPSRVSPASRRSVLARRCRIPVRRSCRRAWCGRRRRIAPRAAAASDASRSPCRP